MVEIRCGVLGDVEAAAAFLRANDVVAEWRVGGAGAALFAIGFDAGRIQHMTAALAAHG